MDGFTDRIAGGDFVELKTILAIVLCLVIIGGAVYLNIKRKKK